LGRYITASQDADSIWSTVYTQVANAPAIKKTGTSSVINSFLDPSIASIASAGSNFQTADSTSPNAQQSHDQGEVPHPLNTTPPNNQNNGSRDSIGINRDSVGPSRESPGAGSTMSPTAQKLFSGVSANEGTREETDSPVMNETLSVIEEHITDMSTPRHSVATNGVERKDFGNGSGSEYSVGRMSGHLDHRQSYITGDETDEEDQETYTEAEVMQWSPNQVAAWLQDSGVDEKHCQVFEEQEISGEVLLTMDQSAIFLKEFELGPVGRRLKTWHKIRSLQEEVKKANDSRGSSQNDGASETHRKGRGSLGGSGTVLPRIPSLMERPGSRAQERIAARQAANQEVRSGSESAITPLSMGIVAPYAQSPGQGSPSRLSLSEKAHRRHSSIDVGAGAIVEQAGTEAASPAPLGSPKPSTTSHKKQPSFDRAWTMQSASAEAARSFRRPTTGVPPATTHQHSSSIDRNIAEPGAVHESGFLTTGASRDLDRGYFSGGELERPRKVLRKREVSSASHSRQSSYVEEGHRRRSSAATTTTRHSRAASASSATPDPSTNLLNTMHLPGANALKEASKGFRGRFLRSSSRVGPREKEEARSMTPTQHRDGWSPSASTSNAASTSDLIGKPYSPEDGNFSSSLNSPISPGTVAPLPNIKTNTYKPTTGRAGGNAHRTISDAVTGKEKAQWLPQSPGAHETTSPRPSSPTRTDSTPSQNKSLSFEDPEKKDSISGNSQEASTTPTSATPKRSKTKKETSAYTKGLAKRSPAQQMEGADMHGWMKKKSSKLMTTWKPRLFILRGRRLSYYYSEDDREERGLIDISGHRVLPASHDRITGLHATLTGAMNSPTSPQTSTTPGSGNSANQSSMSSLDNALEGTQPSALAALDLAQKSPHPIEGDDDQIFIFKLVPPKAGLSKAVNFTRPMVHYFAVDNVRIGRLWMKAIMKVTIERHESAGYLSSYAHETVSLAKARQMRHRPPALMGSFDETTSGSFMKSPLSRETGKNTEATEASKESPPGELAQEIEAGLNIQGIIYPDADDGTSASGGTETNKSGEKSKDTSLELQTSKEVGSVRGHESRASTGSQGKSSIGSKLNKWASNG
jgi:SAM domain (Sterile alpha motif)/PH domain